MTDAPRALTRTMQLPVPKEGDKCDGCAMPLLAGIEAIYRLDGSLFCTDRCAATHAGIPLDNRVTT